MPAMPSGASSPCAPRGTAREIAARPEVALECVGAADRPLAEPLLLEDHGPGGDRCEQQQREHDLDDRARVEHEIDDGKIVFIVSTHSITSAGSAAAGPAPRPHKRLRRCRGKRSSGAPASAAAGSRARTATRAPRAARDARLHLEQVVEPRRARGTRPRHALSTSALPCSARSTSWSTPCALQPFGARALHEAKVARVVNDALRIGVLEIDPDRAARKASCSTRRSVEQPAHPGRSAPAAALSRNADTPTSSRCGRAPCAAGSLPESGTAR